VKALLALFGWTRSRPVRSVFYVGAKTLRRQRAIVALLLYIGTHIEINGFAGKSP
jgi:hypothetical protein